MSYVEYTTEPSCLSKKLISKHIHLWHINCMLFGLLTLKSAQEKCWFLHIFLAKIVSTLKILINTKVCSHISTVGTSTIRIHIQYNWTCNQKAKNQKAKQTIMHCTTNNTRQEIKCNAMKKTVSSWNFHKWTDWSQFTVY